MKKYLLALNFLLLLLSACKKDIKYPADSNNLLTFNFISTTNRSLITNNLSCTISDSLVTGTTTTAIDRSALVATFTTSGETVTVNGLVQVSGVTKNDFRSPVIYTVTSQDGATKSYTVKLTSFTGLPILYITTVAPIVSKDDYVTGTMTIDGNLMYTDGLYDGAIQIKGRGNSTWGQPKEPYKIKLNKKSDILGMPADKEWNLLANYFDKSLMRNDVAFELSERLGMAWTPRRRFVEVFLNGEFEGNYLLTETVEVGTDRLNITTMDENAADTTNGFLVENDARKDADYWFETPLNIPFDMDTPEDVSTVQYNYIKDYVSDMEGILLSFPYSDSTFQQNIDEDSFINWFLVNEIMRNSDAIMYSSNYFYKDKGGKFSMGPVWDFDLSSGVYTGNVAEGWYVKTSNWVGWPFNDDAYRQKVKAKWNSVKATKLTTILTYIDGLKNTLQLSQVQNFKRWDIMNESVFDGSIVTGSYDNEVASLRTFLDTRIKWLDAQINSW